MTRATASGQLPAVGRVVDSWRPSPPGRGTARPDDVLVVEDLGRPSPQEVTELGRDAPPGDGGLGHRQGAG